VPIRKQALWLLALSMSAGACAGGQPGKELTVSVPKVITVQSTAFAEGQPIPTRFTCDGEGDTPPLTWEGVPEGAAALALVVDDPDAPRGTFTHWVVVDLPPGTTTLKAGALPAGAVQARNSGGRTTYYPPCPPSGIHHYRFTVYSLTRPTGLREGAALDAALSAVDSSASASGRLVGTYERRR
jgi:Raf kinase inhibitor-like YbhB/YbcL family protein